MVDSKRDGNEADNFETPEKGSYNFLDYCRVYWKKAREEVEEDKRKALRNPRLYGPSQPRF